MEPQGAVVLPDEAGTFTVTSSTQSLDGVQKAVAETLGIPWHKVTAVCRRVGGGFGGKAVRPMPVAAACAVAAHKLGKQVRLTYNRNADFRQNGGGLLCVCVCNEATWNMPSCQSDLNYPASNAVLITYVYSLDHCVTMSATAKQSVQAALSMEVLVKDKNITIILVAPLTTAR